MTAPEPTYEPAVDREGETGWVGVRAAIRDLGAALTTFLADWQFQRPRLRRMHSAYPARWKRGR